MEMSCARPYRVHGDAFWPQTHRPGFVMRPGKPEFDGVPGYPGQVDPERLSAFTDLADELMAFDADVRAAYLAPLAELRPRDDGSGRPAGIHRPSR
jgi:hypothetical protein